MKYADLHSPRFRFASDADKCVLLLGELVASGPDVLTMRSIVGSFHSVVTSRLDRAGGTARIGSFIIVYKVGDGWELYGEFCDYEGALRNLFPDAANAYSLRRDEHNQLPSPVSA